MQLGNKGACAVGLKWRDTTLAFINCHFAARPERVPQREHDYRQITSKLHLTADRGLDVMHQFEHLFWFGDLNYRIELPFEETVALHEQGKWAEIAQHDQLLREMGRRRIFTGFEEGQLNFPPTYRWSKKTREFSNKRGQSPSWCDRILWRSFKGAKPDLSLECFGGADLLGSDHRPVKASFTLNLRKACVTAPACPLPAPRARTRVRSHTQPHVAHA